MKARTGVKLFLESSYFEPARRKVERVVLNALAK
jgi:hypothetical protein